MVATALISRARTPVHKPARASRARSAAVPVRIIENAAGQDLLDASIALAHTQLAGQLADETGIDAHLMGTLGFTGALLAVDIAAKDLLGAAWWIALVAIGLAAACCLATVLGAGLGARHTDFGPNPTDFYVRNGGQPSDAAREHLLSELVAAFVNNASRLGAKRRAIRVSLAVLAAGLVASTFVIGLDRPTTTRGAHGHARFEA